MTRMGLIQTTALHESSPFAINALALQTLIAPHALTLLRFYAPTLSPFVPHCPSRRAKMLVTPPASTAEKADTNPSPPTPASPR